MNACTIVARNYLAPARVLARSFLRHHPGGRFWVLVIDDTQRSIDAAAEPFELLRPVDVAIEDFDGMSVRYSVIELATAVKPSLLRHLMAQTGGPITYLDPDIEIFGSLTQLDELALKHGVVLTPHNAVPIPDDDRRPSQIDIVLSGVFNLGYITLAPRAEVAGLLDWWGARLLRDCRVDVMRGYFVDQHWFGLVPGFLDDFAVVREPQFNVAYWNLHDRDLSHDGERYLVDGRPLAFFHYSGFDTELPRELSRFQNRVRVHAGTALERILHDYTVSLAAEGHGKLRDAQYGYAALPDGTPLDPVVRSMWQDYEDERGVDATSPFTAAGGEAFAQWLAEPAPGAPLGVHRVLARVWGTTRDLQEVYPDVGGADREGLLRWSRKYGREFVPALGALPLPDGTMPGDGSMSYATPIAEAPSPPWGVNVVGYFNTESGVGEHARQAVAALDAANIQVMPLHGETIPVSRQDHPYLHYPLSEAVFPVSLVCINADSLPEFRAQAGEAFFSGRYTIGMWAWEVESFPERWQGSFSLLDEVWAVSAHAAAAIDAAASVPVLPVGYPVEVAPFEPRSRADLGVPPDGFMFLFAFDYLSVLARKNPLAVLEAFVSAFKPNEHATLVLKCINSDRDVEHHQQLVAAAAAHPQIHVVDRYFDPSEKDALTAACDCYVSLHRAEGFGLTMAEAMYLGKPVIATAYSGNLDFMTAENSLLVDYELVPIGTGADPYPPEARWAEPDVAQAAAHMRRVFDDREFAADLGNRAASDIRTTHSAAAVGERMRDRLERVRENPEHRPVPPGGEPGYVAMPPVPGVTPRRGPVTAGRTRMRRVAARRLLQLAHALGAGGLSVGASDSSELADIRARLASARTSLAVERSRSLAEHRAAGRARRGDTS